MSKESINSLLNKSILITGGAGFIGSNLVDELVRIKHQKILVLDNLETGNLQNLEPHLSENKITFIKGDIRDPETCLKACKGIDIVLHQAALGSVPRSIKDPATTNEVNVNGFINILDACRINGVKRLVYASSSSVYGDDTSLPKVEEKLGDPLSPYAVSKKTNELYAKVYADLYQMEIIGLRYFNVFGPKQNPKGPYAAVIPIFIHNMLRGVDSQIFGNGQNRRDFTYIDNVVQANFLAATVQERAALNQIYNIAAGATTSVLGLFELIRKKLNSTTEAVHLPPRPGEIIDSFAAIAKARNLLGYQTSTDLELGIERTIDWYKKYEAS
jgi:UDP-N-acetylglucosamine/UDP-N-acetylgalactosamine 4-epimerase